MAKQEQERIDHARRLLELFQRLAEGESLRSLADTIHVSFSHLAKIFRGDVKLSEEHAVRLAQFFYLPVDVFKAYLCGEIDLETAVSSSRRAKYALVDFSQGSPPAWKATIRYAEETAGDPEFRRKWVENILVFFVLAGEKQYRDDPKYPSFLFDQLAADHEEFLAWLPRLSPHLRRLVFHALLFTLRPLEYAKDGILCVDRAMVEFQEPDRYIRYPEFAFKVAAEASVFLDEDPEARSD